MTEPTESTEQDHHGPSVPEGLADPYTSFPPFALGDFIDVPDSLQPPGTSPNYWEGPYSLPRYQLPPNLFPDPPAHNPEFPPFALEDLIHLPGSLEFSSNPPTLLGGDIQALRYQWPPDLFPDPPEPNPDGAFLLACPPLDTLHALSLPENDIRRLLSDYHDSLDILNHHNTSVNLSQDPTLAPDQSQRVVARDIMLFTSEAIVKISQSSLQMKQILLEESELWLKRARRLQTDDVVSPEAHSTLKDSFRRQWEDTWEKMEEMEEMKERHARLREEYAKAGGIFDPRGLVREEEGIESANLHARIWGMQFLFVEKGDKVRGEVEGEGEVEEDDDDIDEDEDDSSEVSEGYDPWAYWDKEVEDDAVTEEDELEDEDADEDRVNLFTGETVRPHPRGSWETQPRPSLPAQREESVMDLLAMQHAAFPSHERNRNDPATWRPYTRSSGYGVAPSRLATIPEEEYRNPDDYLPLFLTAFDDQMSLRDPLMDVEWAVSNERGAMEVDEDGGGEKEMTEVSKKGKERAVDPDPPERLMDRSPAHAQPPANNGIRLAKPFFQNRSGTRPSVDTQSRVKPPFKLRVMNPDEQPPEPSVTQRDGATGSEGVRPELGRRARQLKEDESRFNRMIKEAIPSGSGPSAARSSAARSSAAGPSTSRRSAARPPPAYPWSTASPSAGPSSGTRAPAARPSAAGSSTVPSAPDSSETLSDVQPASTAQPQDPNAPPTAGSSTSSTAVSVVPAETLRDGAAYKWLAGMYQRMGQSEEYPIDVD
ncbi:hypothetical protein LTR82_012184 [Friedmanniomyces endolithicus]|uniref:Uncharacterized protein n=1 Tax=Friedmanniomyces endolithicus TaxID=329885 RepID=A0AAN6FFD7_9PEZI|nr:hypothetical protein LTR82_012184 [Friedmanniomyces endolithicus]